MIFANGFFATAIKKNNMTTTEYLNEHKDRFLEELLDLLRIPSISARSEHKADMLACAEAVKDKLLAAGVKQ